MTSTSSEKNNERPVESSSEEGPCVRNSNVQEIVQEEAVTTCVICKDQDNQDPFTFLTCAHGFHTKCISRWIDISSHCPMCRTVVHNSAEHSSGNDSSEIDSIERGLDRATFERNMILVNVEFQRLLRNFDPSVIQEIVHDVWPEIDLTETEGANADEEFLQNLVNLEYRDFFENLRTAVDTYVDNDEPVILF